MKTLSAVILAALSITFLSCGGGGVASAGSAGEIQYFEGIVTVNGQAVEIGLDVMNDDIVVTGPDSFVEIRFGEYRVLNAEENSKLVINAAEKTFKLAKGSLAVVQSKARLFSLKKSWRLETPTVVAAVRGTVYFTRVESPESVYFCLCNGKIHLEDSDDGTVLELDAAHHNAVRFVRSEDGVVYRNARMLYHSDAVMEAVADTVNVPIDWTVIPE